MRVKCSAETNWRFQGDRDFDQALAYGEKLADKIGLDRTPPKNGSPGWARMSRSWETGEDKLLLKLKREFYGSGTIRDTELCIAYILCRTTTAVRTRFSTLVKAKCPCCGK